MTTRSDYGAPAVMDRDLLLSVEKPSRYIGGEVNQVRKGPVRCTVGLCYPDVYEIGMSHLGLQVLYRVVNDRPDMAAERVFCPWPDMEQALRRDGQPLRTLEGHVPLGRLDVLGFTLQFELSYTNLLTVLDLGGIPLLAADRGSDDPVVIGGGPCAYNPEPLADVLDAVCLGDGEELLVEVCEAVADWRERGRGDRELLRDALCAIPGVYVPSRYRIQVGADGGTTAFEPLLGAPERVLRRVIRDLDAAPAPHRPVVPFSKTVHDRLAVEIQRGCARGCRFCQAGVVYRPVRERSPETIRSIVARGLAATGAREVGLLSLSTGDYTCLPDLVGSLTASHAADRVALSLPSLRLETLRSGLLDEIRQVRRSGITLAPEAGTPRLRAVINKVFDEQLLLDAVGHVFERGWRGLKLYFMIGLPTEQESDLRGMVDLVARCRDVARSRRKGAQIRVAVSTFVPKSHTPLQWCPQLTTDETALKHRWLRGSFKRIRADIKVHGPFSSFLEGVFARGDRRLGPVLLEAWRAGARMDGWGDHLRRDIWEQVFARSDVDPWAIACRTRGRDERLPWDHLAVGVDRDWLWSEYEAALEAGGCHDCTTGACYSCGVCDPPLVRNRLYDRDAPASRARAVVSSRPRGEPSAPIPTAESGEILDTRLPAELRLRLRIRYARVGRAALLSHLETVSLLQRAIRRARLPALHTSGFNPHLKLTFTDPNPVGMESDAEVFELEVRPPVDEDDVAARLQGAMPEGFTVHSVESVPARSPALGASLRERVYQVSGLAAGPSREAAERLQQPLVLQVERRKGVREVDVASVVRAEPLDGGGLMLTLEPNAGVRPREVVRALVGEGASREVSVRKVAQNVAPWPPAGGKP